MKILFLGVTSFSGFHFVKRLSKNKLLKIYCTLTKRIEKYKHLKKKRTTRTPRSTPSSRDERRTLSRHHPTPVDVVSPGRTTNSQS